MAARSKLDPMPSGNPILGRLSRIDSRLDKHEARLDGHDLELRELNMDIALLGDVVLRAKLRARSRRKLATKGRNRPG